MIAPEKIKHKGLIYKRADTVKGEEPWALRSTGHLYGVVKTPSGMRVADVTGGRTKSLVQYIDHGNVKEPVDGIKLAPRLEPGIYAIKQSMGNYLFDKQAMNTDELLRFEDPIHAEILGELDKFWAQKDKYAKKGFLHNRALLMFGPPGSGKSCLIKLAMEDLTSKGDVVFTCSDIYTVNKGLKTFREVEPDRRCLAILEDVDELGEHSLLQLLDGVDTADNIMYLATTNYVNRLSERVLRPGRFDRKIEVPYPPEAGRRAYLESKLHDEGLSKEQMEYLVKASEGFSFGHLRELVTGAFCMGQPVQVVLDRLNGSGLERHASVIGKGTPKKIKHKGRIYVKVG